MPHVSCQANNRFIKVICHNIDNKIREDETEKG